MAVPLLHPYWVPIKETLYRRLSHVQVVHFASHSHQSDQLFVMFGLLLFPVLRAHLLLLIIYKVPVFKHCLVLLRVHCFMIVVDPEAIIQTVKIPCVHFQLLQEVV